jgi:hypothetical protein
MIEIIDSSKSLSGRVIGDLFEYFNHLRGGWRKRLVFLLDDFDLSG